MSLEFRAAETVEVQADGRAKGRVTVTPMRYNVLDDFETQFRPRCFSDYLAHDAPVFCWGHDHHDPIGQMVDAEEKPDRLRMNMQLDLDEAVPRARQALVQMTPHPETGRATMRCVSVGFRRREIEKLDDGTIAFVRCDLPEVSVVLSGAVPGASVDSVRSGRPILTSDDAIVVAVRLHAGEITLDEALMQLRGGPPSAGPLHTHARNDGSGVVKHSHVGGGPDHAHGNVLMPAMDWPKQLSAATTPRSTEPAFTPAPEPDDDDDDDDDDAEITVALQRALATIEGRR